MSSFSVADSFMIAEIDTVTLGDREVSNIPVHLVWHAFLVSKLCCLTKAEKQYVKFLS